MRTNLYRLACVVAIHGCLAGTASAQTPPGIRLDAATQLLRNVVAEAQECRLLDPPGISKEWVEKTFLTHATQFFPKGRDGILERFTENVGQIRSGESLKALPVERILEKRVPEVVIGLDPQKTEARVWLESALFPADLKKLYSNASYVPWNKPYPPTLDGPDPNDPGHYVIPVQNSRCSSDVTVQFLRQGGMSYVYLTEKPRG